MLDNLLDWVVVFLPTILSVLGVLVSVKAPHSKHHTAWRIGLFVLGVLISVATFWQQSRSRSAHAAEVAVLNGSLTSVRSDLSNVQTQTTALQNQVKDLTSAQQAEVGRRQQAEKDLAIIVQASGKATRQGVAEDIRKSPIQVEVNGQPIAQSAMSAEEKKAIRQVLGNFLLQGQQLRDQCATDISVEQLTKTGQAWYDSVRTYLTLHLDSSYVSQFELTHPEPLSPASVRKEMLPLWYGLYERTQTLSKFIDELK